jgi:hypothetical protein
MKNEESFNSTSSSDSNDDDGDDDHMLGKCIYVSCTIEHRYRKDMWKTSFVRAPRNTYSIYED